MRFYHLHHRLIGSWLTKNQALLLIYSLSLLFWITWLFLDRTWKIIIFFIIAIIVLFLNKIVEFIIWKKWKQKPLP